MGSVNTILQSGNIHRTQKAEYEANKMMQESGNKLSAKQTALQEFTRTLGNNLRVEAAGKEYNAAVGNIAATLEARGTGKINASLAAAEKVGALTAQASALGVGGTSVELLNTTIKLQKEQAQELQEMSTKRYAIGSAKASAQGMDNAYSGTDLTQHFGNFDHTRSIAPKEMKRKWGKLVGVAAATFFGGPMAGEAVASIAVADWQASNGNFSGMAQSVDGALTSGLQGYKTWSELQGGGGADTWFGAVTQKQDNARAAAESKESNYGGEFFGQSNMFGSDFGW